MQNVPEALLVLESIAQSRLSAAVAAYKCGQVIELSDGRAAFVEGLNPPAIGDPVCAVTLGQVQVPLTASVVILDGGKVYWDFTNRKANYKKSGSQDFYLGRAVGDADTTNSVVIVQLNVDPRYDMSVDGDPFTSVIVGTSAAGGFGYPYRRGSAHGLVVSATSEAQKVDALANDSFAAGGALAVVEMGINVISGSAGTNPDFNVGIASATHASDADAIAQHLFMHIDGNSTKINFQSKDGTNTTAATDSTLTYTAATRFEVWFDLRDNTNVKIYVNGARVLAATTFNVSAAALAWKLLAHLEKTVSTDTGDFQVDFLRARFAQQRA